MSRDTDLEFVLVEVKNELKRAQRDYAQFNTAHEGYAILLEELDELWDIVKKKQMSRDYSAMGNEAKQIAAMAIRFYLDCCTPEGKGYGR